MSGDASRELSWEQSFLLIQWVLMKLSFSQFLLMIRLLFQVINIQISTLISKPHFLDLGNFFYNCNALESGQALKYLHISLKCKWTCWCVLPFLNKHNKWCTRSGQIEINSINNNVEWMLLWWKLILRCWLFCFFVFSLLGINQKLQTKLF